MNKLKFVLICVCCVTLLIVFGIAVDRIIRNQLILPGFLELEQHQAEDDVMRCVDAIDRENYHLGLLALDWAEWDDTYTYVRDSNSAYEQSNFQQETLVSAGIDLIYIVDEQGVVIHGKVFDPETVLEINLAGFPQERFPADHYLLLHSSDSNGKRGILVSDHGPVLLAAQHILTSEGTGVPRGTLIMGRFLRPGIVEELSRQTRVEFSLYPWSEAAAVPEATQLGTMAKEALVLTELLPGASHLDGYTILADIAGNPGLLLHASISRDVFRHGLKTAGFVSTVIVLFISSIVVILFALLIFSSIRAQRRENRVEALVGQRTLELAVSRERMRILAEAAFEGIILLEDGICLLVNKRVENMFGYTSDELVGRPSTDLIYASDRDRSRESIDGMHDKLYEILGQRKDGSIFPLAIYGKSVEFEGRNVRAAALRDLTERKKEEVERAVLEERLRRSQKMESIGLMAGGVAHDLNNILSGLVTYPELILLTLSKDSTLCNPLKAIHSAGKRAAEVVADLLTVARGVAMVIKPESLNAIIREYLASPEYKKLGKTHPNVKVVVTLAENLPHVLGSAIHINKCLMNLVTNGAEAVDGAGTISISTRSEYVEETKETETALKAGEYAVLRVEDTGTGISEEDLEHIFEPFYSRKVIGRSGTGLGLAVVWNTMQDHKGGVQVNSSEQGTVFDLYFPATTKTLEIPMVENIESLKGNGESILVVDDDSDQLEIALQILKNLRYSVTTVNAGEKAVAYLQEQPADLVILDMLMGQGMSGYETYVEILKDNPLQKALIASGFSESEEVRKTLALGAGLFIRKPYSVSQMGRAVKQALG